MMHLHTLKVLVNIMKILLFVEDMVNLNLGFDHLNCLEIQYINR